MSVMDITILGRNGSLQDRLSGNTSLLVDCGNVSVLVDCSSNLQEAVEKENLQAVVVTHGHVDHLYGFPSLIHQLWLKGRKEALDVYARPEVQKILASLLDAFLLREKKGMFDIVFHSTSSFSIDDLKVELFDTDHAPGSIGMVFIRDGKKVAYTSDTRPIAAPDQVLMDADLLITEASGLSDKKDDLVKKGHQGGLEAAALALASRARKLVLVHLPCSDSARDAIQSQAREVFACSFAAVPLAHYEV